MQETGGVVAAIRSRPAKTLYLQQLLTLPGHFLALLCLCLVMVSVLNY